MKKMLLLLSVAGLALCEQAAGANLHWKGPDGVFEEMSSWTENNKVPTAEDFIIVKNYSGSNWSVSFTNDETSWKSELGTPLTDSETVFKLNGYAWALTLDIHMGELTSGGGRIAFTNGTLRAPSLSFVPSVTNNLLLSMKDVACEAGTAEYGATRATFEGGSLNVSARLSVGVPGYGVGTLSLDKGAQCGVSNAFYVGEAVGATGELFNINGQLVQTGADGSFIVGRNGCGSMSIQGGSTYIDQTPILGYNNTGVGLLTVTGGSNTFGKVSGKLLVAGEYGKGMIWAEGGTNYANGLSLGHSAGSYGEMVLTGGVWNVSSYSWIAYFGRAVVSINGGRLNSGPSFCIGRGTGTGEVSVAGGTLDVNGEVRLGGNATSVGRLTLTGTGVLRAGYISEYSAGANSELLFDGGTLQARTSAGALIRSVDDIRLTANGLVVDTVGYNAVITGVLQNASGEAGSITKKGAGTLTLVGTRTATGSVSALGGTLVMSEQVTVSAGTSRIDGLLTLAADNRLIVGTDAALAGTGTVARVTLQDNALFARAKADNAVTPLTVGDCAASDRLTIALTGYTLGELKTTLPLIRMPTASIDTGKVTVTLNGQPYVFLSAKYVADGGQQVLSVSYSAGTLIRVL